MNDDDEASEPRVLAGRYELGALLGRGGMGSVRVATDLRLERSVAVKILRPDLADQPKARRRFETEARAAARLAHPNVVTVFDSGEDAGIPFLVMERLRGRTLADEIAEGQLAIRRVEEVAREVLSALAAAHRAGIIHRDIKPGNVLLTDDGHAKVSDFGIAKTIDDSDQTQTLELVATLGYLAPERLAGEAASQRSDLYSVGVLLYEASSGRRPFVEATPPAEMLAIERGHPPALASLRSPVPDTLVAVIERSMARDPARRFGSAEEMAAALDGHPRDDTTVPIATAAAAETVPIEVAPAADAPETTLLPPRPADDPAPPPAVPTNRRLAGVGIAALLVAFLVVAFVVSRRSQDHPASSVPPTTSVPAPATPSTTLPVPLDNAIQRLEQDVAG
jgi:serine/threonine-protein kinase